MGTLKQASVAGCRFGIVGEADLIIFVTTLAPVAFAIVSLTAAQMWRTLLRRKFEVDARTLLVRNLGFRGTGRKTLGAHVNGMETRVVFGLSDETGWGAPRAESKAVQYRRQSAKSLHAPNQWVCAIIDVECRADLPVPELWLEASPPVVVRGRADIAFALLELPLRALLREGERVQWRHQRLRITTCHARDGQTFGALIEKATAVAATLQKSAGRDVERRLVDEALFCRAPESRLRAMRLLATYYCSPLSHSTLFRLSGDNDPLIQLHAARALGREGFPKLRVLAERKHVAGALRSQAVELLVEGGDRQLDGMLRRLLRDDNIDVARLALKHLGLRMGLSAMPDIRAVVLRPNAEEALVLAGIDYLERVGFSQAAEILLTLVDHGAEPVRIAAIDVIGKHGDLNWLVMLKQRLHHRSTSAKVSISLDAAVTLIRARHGAGAGRLSLSSEASGGSIGALSPSSSNAVSLAEAVDGGLEWSSRPKKSPEDEGLRGD